MFKEGVMSGDQVFVEWLGNFADVNGDGSITKAVRICFIFKMIISIGMG